MKDMRISRSIIIGVLGLLLLPMITRAEEAPQPNAAQPQPSSQTQNNTDQTWKEQLEKKHVQFIEWLQANYPEKAADLLAIRTKKPEEFVQQLGEIMKIYEPIKKAENNNPELAKTLRRDLELQDQRDKLLKEISQADDDQLPELHKQLRDVVAARFDLIIHKKQLYYDHLRRRLERIKQKIEEQAKELEKLNAEKDQSVEKRMKELTEGVESLDW